MPHVLVLGAFNADALATLRATPGFTLEEAADLSPAGIRAALPRADAVMCRTYPIGREEVAAAPRLRIVTRHGVGYDIIDVPALTERGIVLTITPEANAQSVAEHAMMLMLACARRVTAYDARMRVPSWGTTAELPSFELAGRTVLVMGFGRIGARVARLCAAFGMRVLVRDPFMPKGTIRGCGHAPVDDLPAALAEADVVTLHTPSNAQTRGMVDAAFLAAMRRGAVLVNTSRGTVLDQAALEAALRSGHLAAAGLDVFEEEPVTKPIPLLSAPHLVLTPHAAASTQEGLRRMAFDSVANTVAFFAGTLDPDVVVNREVLARG